MDRYPRNEREANAVLSARPRIRLLPTQTYDDGVVEGRRDASRESAPITVIVGLSCFLIGIGTGYVITWGL